MDHRKELKSKYKEAPKIAGIFQIRNLRTGRVFLASSMDMRAPFNRHEFMLKMNGHPNAALQADWNALGRKGFALEVLDTVDESVEEGAARELELGALEALWFEKLEPMEEHCYNTHRRIRL
jgi:hypothetical protein